MSLPVTLGLTQALALTMSVAFLTYVCLIVVPYLRHRPAPPGGPGAFDWHFFVPCRDEEAVIGDTVRYLLDTFPPAQVWVIDDASDDAAAEVVASFTDLRVHLVSRLRPEARTAKETRSTRRTGS